MRPCHTLGRSWAVSTNPPSFPLEREGWDEGESPQVCSYGLILLNLPPMPGGRNRRPSSFPLEGEGRDGGATSPLAPWPRAELGGTRMGFVITAAADAAGRSTTSHLIRRRNRFRLSGWRNRSRVPPHGSSPTFLVGIMRSRVLPPFRTNRCTGTEAACFGGEHSCELSRSPGDDGKPTIVGTRITVESILTPCGGESQDQIIQANPRLTRTTSARPWPSRPRCCTRT